MKAKQRHYNSKSKNAIDVKVITFVDKADFILSLTQWNDFGGWKGVIKKTGIPLRDVDKVYEGKMNPVDFVNLDEWCG